MAQVALALVLLISSGLMIRTFQNLRQVEPGFIHAETLQTLEITAPLALLSEPERVPRMHQDILNRLAAIPGVASAAYVNQLPMDPGNSQIIVAAQDKTYGVDNVPPTHTLKFISPGWFRTVGTRLLAGRDLNWGEVLEQRNVALVSATFARETWNTIEGALGKRIRVGTNGPWQEVIGVAADVYENGADQPTPGIVYWPAREQQVIGGPLTPPAMAFTLRSRRAGTEGLLREIRQALSAAYPDLPIAQVRTLEEVYDKSMARTSFTLVLLGIAGAMALLIGIVGIYGVLAYAVVQRQREVGIRLALGAQPRAVREMFVYRGMILSVAGIALGAAVAAGVTRWMSSLLFGVKPVDATTFAAAAGVLVLAALAASYIPARRAAAVNPIETLRGN